MTRGGVEGIRPQVQGHGEGGERDTPRVDQVGRDTGGGDHGRQDRRDVRQADPPRERPATDDSEDHMTPMRGLQFILKVMMPLKIGKTARCEQMVKNWEGSVRLIGMGLPGECHGRDEDRYLDSHDA